MKGEKSMKLVKVFHIVLIGMTVLISASVGDPVTVSFDLDSAILEERGQLKQLKYYPSEHAIKLNDMFLLEDDAPGNGPPMGFDTRE